MPEFAYIARNMQGTRVTGVIAAATEGEASSMLAGQSLFPLQIDLEEQKAPPFFRRRVRGQTMAVAYGQLAGLLRSGVPLLKSLKVLQELSSHPSLQTVLGLVREQVEEGTSLADAMQQHDRTFNTMAINMVRAGEQGGFLEDALDRVAQFTEQQEDLKARTVSALAYPVFLAIVGIVVVSCLMVFFVPSFEEMFARLKERGELPLMTTWLMRVSHVLQNQGLLILGCLALFAFLLRSRLATESGQRRLDLLKIRIPMAGGIFLSLAVARFCRVLGTLLHNGVAILKGLEISSAAAGNQILSEAIQEATENVTAGESLATPLAASGYFPRDVVEMIAVAEESNTLDTVLVTISESLERRTERRLDLLVRLLEPVMLLIMAGVVLVMVLALLLPVMKMSSAI